MFRGRGIECALHAGLVEQAVAVQVRGLGFVIRAGADPGLGARAHDIRAHPVFVQLRGATVKPLTAPLPAG